MELGFLGLHLCLWTLRKHHPWATPTEISMPWWLGTLAPGCEPVWLSGFIVLVHWRWECGGKGWEVLKKEPRLRTQCSACSSFEAVNIDVGEALFPALPPKAVEALGLPCLPRPSRGTSRKGQRGGIRFFQVLRSLGPQTRVMFLSSAYRQKR